MKKLSIKPKSPIEFRQSEIPSPKKENEELIRLDLEDELSDVNIYFNKNNSIDNIVHTCEILINEKIYSGEYNFGKTSLLKGLLGQTQTLSEIIERSIKLNSNVPIIQRNNKKKKGRLTRKCRKLYSR